MMTMMMSLKIFSALIVLIMETTTWKYHQTFYVIKNVNISFISVVIIIVVIIDIIIIVIIIIIVVVVVVIHARVITMEYDVTFPIILIIKHAVQMDTWPESHPFPMSTEALLLTGAGQNGLLSEKPDRYSGRLCKRLYTTDPLFLRVTYIEKLPELVVIFSDKILFLRIFFCEIRVMLVDVARELVRKVEKNKHVTTDGRSQNQIQIQHGRPSLKPDDSNLHQSSSL